MRTAADKALDKESERHKYRMSGMTYVLNLEIQKIGYNIFLRGPLKNSKDCQDVTNDSRANPETTCAMATCPPLLHLFCPLSLLLKNLLENYRWKSVHSGDKPIQRSKEKD